MNDPSKKNSWRGDHRPTRIAFPINLLRFAALFRMQSAKRF